MTPFILDPAGIAELHRIRDYARKHPYREGAMKALVEGRGNPPGDNAGFSCVLPLAFRIVLTLEEHQNSTWAYHLSVSVIGKPDRLPTIPMVEMVMKEIGFKGTINDQYNVWIEDLPGVGKAINVLGPAEAPE
jgi:hypothetical protein